MTTRRLPKRMNTLAQPSEHQWWKMLPTPYSAPALPIRAMLHCLFSIHSLYRKQRNVRLHTHHMLAFASYMLAHRVVLLLIQAVFATTSGQPFGDPADVLLVQTSAIALTGFVYFALATSYLVTLPASLHTCRFTQLTYWCTY